MLAMMFCAFAGGVESRHRDLLDSITKLTDSPKSFRAKARCYARSRDAQACHEKSPQLIDAAIRERDIARLRALVKFGYAQDHWKKVLLQVCAQSKIAVFDVQAVRCLLQAGADPNYTVVICHRLTSPFVALMRATGNPNDLHYQIASCLLDHGAAPVWPRITSIYVRENDFYYGTIQLSLFDFAIEQGCSDWIAWLLACGQSPSADRKEIVSNTVYREGYNKYAKHVAQICAQASMHLPLLADLKNLVCSFLLPAPAGNDVVVDHANSLHKSIDNG
jgi:hypothetical protein